MELILDFRATRSVSWNLFWIFVPQDLSLGTSFGFSCHKNYLMARLLDARAARTILWHGFWILVPQDLSHGTSFRFSWRKTGLLEHILDSRDILPFSRKYFSILMLLVLDH